MEKAIRVMIVDDMRSIRMKYEKMLEKEPGILVVAQAQSGYEAIAQCAVTRPDVVLMDIEMESANAGIEAAQTILQQFPNTKIVIITVYDEDHYIYDAFQYGVCDYLLKDANKQEVVRCIINAYRETSPIRPNIAGRIRQEYQRTKQFEGDALYNMYLLKILTESEIDILRLYHSGMTRQQICAERFIEPQTLKTHTRNILKKFHQSSLEDVLVILNQCNFFSCMDKLDRENYSS